MPAVRTLRGGDGRPIRRRRLNANEPSRSRPRDLAGPIGVGHDRSAVVHRRVDAVNGCGGCRRFGRLRRRDGRPVRRRRLNANEPDRSRARSSSSGRRIRRRRRHARDNSLTRSVPGDETGVLAPESRSTHRDRSPPPIRPVAPAAARTVTLPLPSARKLSTVAVSETSGQRGVGTTRGRGRPELGPHRLTTVASGTQDLRQSAAENWRGSENGEHRPRLR